MKPLQLLSTSTPSYRQYVKDYYLEDGKAVIFCHTDGLTDVISKYSVSGRENMNAELTAYLDDNIFYVPLSCSIIIRFTGKDYSKDEQATIKRTISTEYNFRLALTRQKQKKNLLYSVITLGLGILFLIMYFVLHASGIAGIAVSILFWFFLWEFGTSGWTLALSLRNEISHAKRIAEADIQFSP